MNEQDDTLPSWWFEVDDEDDVDNNTSLLQELEIDLPLIYRCAIWMLLGPLGCHFSGVDDVHPLSFILMGGNNSGTGSNSSLLLGSSNRQLSSLNRDNSGVSIQIDTNRSGSAPVSSHPNSQPYANRNPHSNLSGSTQSSTFGSGLAQRSNSRIGYPYNSHNGGGGGGSSSNSSLNVHPFTVSQSYPSSSSSSSMTNNPSINAPLGSSSSSSSSAGNHPHQSSSQSLHSTASTVHTHNHHTGGGHTGGGGSHTGGGGSNSNPSPHIDFWGPCMIISLYGALLWLARQRDVSFLYLIWSLASLFNHFICRVFFKPSKLLAHYTILGYSVTPVLPIAAAIVLFHPPVWVCTVLEVIACCWSSVAAMLSYMIVFKAAIVEDQRRRLSLVLPVVVLMELYIISLLPIRRY